MPSALMASIHGRQCSSWCGRALWCHSMSWLPHLQIHTEGSAPRPPFRRVNSARQRSQSIQYLPSWIVPQQGGNRALYSSGLSFLKAGHSLIGVFHHGSLSSYRGVGNAWPCGIAWLGAMVPVISCVVSLAVSSASCSVAPSRSTASCSQRR